MIAAATHSARCARASFVSYLQVAAHYRANMAVWTGSSLIQIVVYMSIWRAVAASVGSGSVAGYTPEQFAGYYLVLLLVRDLVFTWVPWHFPDKVRTGELSPMLLRPMHPLIALWGEVAAFRLQGTIILIPTSLLLFVLFDAEINSSAAAVAWSLVLLPLASATRFLLDSLLSVSSFWLTRIDGIRGLYMLIMVLLSGQFAPLAVFPEPVQVAAKFLPFYWTLGFPVELLTGRRPPHEAIVGVVVLAGWVVVSWLALRWAWARGVRRYSAVGA